MEKINHENGLPKGDLGRIGIAIAPSNPNRVYAKVEAKKNAIYRSDDGGKYWIKINDNPKFTNNRPFIFKTWKLILRIKKGSIIFISL